MRRWLPVLGYTAAALTLAVAILTPFVLLGSFKRGVVALGLRIDPVYSGGEVARTIDRGAWRVMIYQVVPQRAPLSPTPPFVQVKWTPAAALPPDIVETLDLDGDGVPDVRAEFHVPPAGRGEQRMDLIGLSPLVRSAHGIGRDSFSSMIARVNDSIVARVPLVR